MSMTEILATLESQGNAFTKQVGRLDTLERGLEEVLKRTGRPSFAGAGGETAQQRTTWIDARTRERIPVLEHKDSLLSLEPDRSGALPSIGRILRGLVTRADDAAELAEERKSLAIVPDVSGGFTVAGALSAQWIDLLRSQMVLSRAGVSTIPMPTKSLAIARLTGDPGVSWRGENAPLVNADPTFGCVNLEAKTVACLVKMSLELSQDSANIEEILTSTLTAALAGAIDQAGLTGVDVDAAAAPAGIFNAPGRNTVTSIGAPSSWDFVLDAMAELAYDNVPFDSIGALIGHPKLWLKLAKLRTGLASDNSPLPLPAEVAGLPKLWTTAAPLTGGTTAKAIIGRWSDLLFGVRKSITVRVLSEAFLGSNLQLAVLCYARVDFVPAREQSFCTLEGITVA